MGSKSNEQLEKNTEETKDETGFGKEVLQISLSLLDVTKKVSEIERNIPVAFNKIVEGINASFAQVAERLTALESKKTKKKEQKND